MTEPRRIPGFIRIARSIVQAEPGLTAQQIVSRALRDSETTGIPLSAAANPEASLTATLHKVHGDYGLERRPGKDGRYRYYLVAQELTADPAAVEKPPVDVLASSLRTGYSVDSESRTTPTVEKHPDDAGCCVELSSSQISQIRALVALRLYPSEHGAHTGLVKEGLKAVLAKLPNLT